jgi:hypothetical protein
VGPPTTRRLDHDAHTTHSDRCRDRRRGRRSSRGHVAAAQRARDTHTRRAKPGGRGAHRGHPPHHSRVQPTAPWRGSFRWPRENGRAHHSGCSSRCHHTGQPIAQRNGAVTRCRLGGDPLKPRAYEPGPAGLVGPSGDYSYQPRARGLGACRRCRSSGRHSAESRSLRYGLVRRAGLHPHERLRPRRGSWGGRRR